MNWTIQIKHLGQRLCLAHDSVLNINNNLSNLKSPIGYLQCISSKSFITDVISLVNVLLHIKNTFKIQLRISSKIKE